ncbi:MAG: carbon-nitrogen hydrolase family protein [Bacteriovoracaceae bacterium]
MLNIGVAQTKNTNDYQSNFIQIFDFLKRFEQTNVDLILFPECSLSGFTSKNKDCTLDLLEQYFEPIEAWSVLNNKTVILPTAIVEDKIYNSGYVFSRGNRSRFYKHGLTKSEQNYFSVPNSIPSKIYELNGYRFALLICFEAQLDPYSYFKAGEVDFILWPGYWGWTLNDNWSAFKNGSEENLVFKNMQQWKVPLIQANFSRNGDGLPNPGPQGLSVVVDHNNELIWRGDFEAESAFIVTLDKKSVKAVEFIC